MIRKNLKRIELFKDAPWYEENNAISSTKILSYIQGKLDDADLPEGDRDIDSELEAVSDLAFYADCSLSKNNIESVAINMFLLGLHVQILNSVFFEDSIDMLREKLTREEPLQKKMIENRALYSLAKELAIEVWNQDEIQELTLSDVCHEVYAIIYQLLSKTEGVEPDDLEFNARLFKRMPNTADGFKKCLREVAPSYATKPGRRKK